MDIDYLVSTYGSYIYNYAFKLCCHPSAAEDLAQETFVKAWRSLNQLMNEKAVKPWLKKICLNTFLMEIRKKNNQEEICCDDLETLDRDGSFFDSVFSLPTPEDEVMVDEAIRELQNGCFYAMARKLSLNQRITFSLVDMFGLSIDEVADILGLSKAAVKGLLYRARMNLDGFFHSHCSVIEAANPCSCQAWIGFIEQRSDIQNEVLKEKLATRLDYAKSGYTFDATVRSKVQYLYKNMPDRKPSIDWYQQIIDLIKEMF